jgi:hypothetical protein
MGIYTITAQKALAERVVFGLGHSLSSRGGRAGGGRRGCSAVLSPCARARNASKRRSALALSLSFLGPSTRGKE